MCTGYWAEIAAVIWGKVGLALLPGVNDLNCEMSSFTYGREIDREKGFERYYLHAKPSPIQSSLCHCIDQSTSSLSRVKGLMSG